MAAFSAGGFDEADPAAFYLLDGRADMERMADAALVVAGKSLPVHGVVRTVAPPLLRRRMRMPLECVVH